MFSASRLAAILGWDGLLPLVVVGSSSLATAVLPKGDPLIVAAIFLVPVVAIIIRGHAGHQQITRVCHGRAPLLRQLALGLAIILLLLFEIGTNILTSINDEPQSVWLWPLGFFAGYLALMLIALRPYAPAGYSENGEALYLTDDLLEPDSFDSLEG